MNSYDKSLTDSRCKGTNYFYSKCNLFAKIL